MKLLVGIPYNGGTDPPCMEALDALDWCGMRHDFDVRRNYGVDMARNRIGAHALSGGYDYLLFVDADVMPPPDALANLLEHDADVCTGWYVNRHAADGRRTCLAGLEKPWKWYDADDLRAKRESGVYTLRVNGGGLGCCLVRTSVFDALKFPWFVWEDVRFDRDTGEVSSRGEDVGFFVKLEQAGIPVYADTRVECGHIGDGG